MRKFLAVAAAGLLLVGCSGMSGADKPTTTTKAATTTEDPAPLIRQYASAVATAQPLLAKQGSCTPPVDCAIEGTTAYTELLARFSALGVAPTEIERLTGSIAEAKGKVGQLTADLSECVDGAGDNYNQTCQAEAMALQAQLGTVYDGLSGWRPYM